MAIEIRDILDQFNADWESDEHNRDEALEDMHFMRGGEYQWPSSVVSDRKQKGRPIITVNQMNQFVRQVSGDIRQSQPAIECYPVDDQTDPVLSDIYEGAIRQIEYQSGAQSIYSHGAECAIQSGIGHWRVVTDYVDDSAFEQDIFIRRILDPLAVIWDGNATEMDRSDAKHTFVTELLLDREFKARYPGASVSPTPDGVRTNSRANWQDGDFVRIAEYWLKEPVDIELGLTADGQTINLTEAKAADPQGLKAMQQFTGADNALELMLGITRTRNSQTHNVVRYVISGSEILEDRMEWVGKHIPIVPVIGSEMSVNGEIVRKSLIRDAKPAQQLYNFWRSHAAESIALAPKAPWLVQTGNIKGLESFWNRANKDNLPYLPFKPSDDGFKPERQQPAAPPTAMWQEAQVARDDMQATTGIYDASLGQRSNETSGKAIMARQREGDTGSFVFIDNFNQAIRRTGQILLDIIPKVYDSERIIRVMTSDEQQQFVPINKVVMAPNGQEQVINDLSTGRFDVRIKTGPSYTTSREEAKEQLGMLLQSSPDLLQIIGDIYFDNLDFNGADKIAERMKRLLPPELREQDPDDPNAGQQPPDPVAMAAQRLQFKEQEVKIAGEQAKIEKTQAETAKVIAETEHTEVETEATAFEMGVQDGLNGQ